MDKRTVSLFLLFPAKARGRMANSKQRQSLITMWVCFVCTVGRLRQDIADLYPSTLSTYPRYPVRRVRVSNANIRLCLSTKLLTTSRVLSEASEFL